MEDFDTMIHKFDVIKDTHPQLYLFWVNYLTIKKQRFCDILDNANNMLQMIDDENDLSLEDIKKIFIMSQILYA